MQPEHRLKITIPTSALRELDALEKSGLSFPAGDLVRLVNQVVGKYLPQDHEQASGRVRQELTLRALRHYQTLGCIDPPVRVERVARYEFRHYLQALMIRRLLWERVPASHIRQMLLHRSTAEYKQMLLTGIEITARAPSGGDQADARHVVETWLRVPLAPGIELHIRRPLTSVLKPALPSLIAAFTNAIRNHFFAKS
jgi:DNA-binding transcriptional MerR regulator